jgi:hypothetical protein
MLSHSIAPELIEWRIVSQNKDNVNVVWTLGERWDWYEER